MLVTVAVATAGSALLGLTPWWVTIPPAGLLGMYLLLLREAAHADSENAVRQAQARARAARAARARAARERAREAHTAPLQQPAAEIIDISALAHGGGQLYDQYADAEVRAVGD